MHISYSIFLTCTLKKFLSHMSSFSIQNSSRLTIFKMCFYSKRQFHADFVSLWLCRDEHCSDTSFGIEVSASKPLEWTPKISKHAGSYGASCFVIGLQISINTAAAAAAAAAKLLQSCPTLCNPRDGSPPGCHFLLQCMKVKSERVSTLIGFNKKDFP